MFNDYAIRWRVVDFAATHRVALSSILSAISSLALTLSLETVFSMADGWRWFWMIAFVILSVMLVSVSIAPSYYERIQYAEALLPIICDVLKLDKTARLTIHHVRDMRTQTYEQLVDYYPTRVGRGRTFVFTQGITGQAFRTRHSQAYSIPDNTPLDIDYQSRWAFTEDEIGRLSKYRRSFYAYPIGEAGSYAKIVIYFDSADDKTFCMTAKTTLDHTMDTLFRPILERLLGVGPKPSST
jgi:hypothetical protein